MLISAFVNGFGRKLKQFRLPHNLFAGKIRNFYLSAPDNGNFPVFHPHDFFGFSEQSGNIAGNKIFVLSDSDNERGVFLNGNELVRFLLVDNSQGKSTVKKPHGVLYRLFKSGAVFQFPVNQMNNRFRICLRCKMIAVGRKFLSELKIIFDNSVMNQSQIFVCRTVRMSIFQIRQPVRCPADMSDAAFRHCIFSGFRPNDLAKII